MTVAQLLDRYVAEEAVHKASGSDDGQRAGTLKRALGGYGAANLTPLPTCENISSPDAVYAPRRRSCMS